MRYAVCLFLLASGISCKSIPTTQNSGVKGTGVDVKANEGATVVYPAIVQNSLVVCARTCANPMSFDADDLKKCPGAELKGMLIKDFSRKNQSIAKMLVNEDIAILTDDSQLNANGANNDLKKIHSDFQNMLADFKKVQKVTAGPIFDACNGDNEEPKPEIEVEIYPRCFLVWDMPRYSTYSPANNYGPWWVYVRESQNETVRLKGSYEEYYDANKHIQKLLKSGECAERLKRYKIEY